MTEVARPTHVQLRSPRLDISIPSRQMAVLSSSRYEVENLTCYFISLFTFTFFLKYPTKIVAVEYILQNRKRWKKFESEMPCEMITLQLGQCGNQSEPFVFLSFIFFFRFEFYSQMFVGVFSWLTWELFEFKLVSSFGNACALNTASVLKESWKITLRREQTGRMYFFISPTTSIIYQELYSWIWSLALFTQSWTPLTLK